MTTTMKSCMSCAVENAEAKCLSRTRLGMCLHKMGIFLVAVQFLAKRCPLVRICILRCSKFAASVTLLSRACRHYVSARSSGIHTYLSTIAVWLCIICCRLILNPKPPCRFTLLQLTLSSEVSSARSLAAYFGMLKVQVGPITFARDCHLNFSEGFSHVDHRLLHSAPLVSQANSRGGCCLLLHVRSVPCDFLL